jgi:peptide chain release factor subunit 1
VISRTELQRIGEHQHDAGQVLSVYLPLSPDGTSDHNIEVKNLLRNASETYERQRGEPLPDEMQAVLEEIRTLVRDDAGKFGRGMAVFATPDAGIVEQLSVPGTVNPVATFDDHADIAPLIGFVEDYQPYCLCLISRDHARLFLGQLGEIEEHTELKDDEVPGQHDQGGWSQARYERHIEDHVHRHFKRVADVLFRLPEEHPYDVLILAGPEEVVAGFKDVLHPYVRERYIGDVRLLMEANINDVHEHASDVLEKWIVKRKRDLLASIQEEALSRDLGVQGLTETLAALQRGQIMNLVIDSQVSSSGVICNDCGALSISVSPDGGCPFCGGSIREVDNIIPTMITRAYEQGASVSIIEVEEQRELLASLGGVAALLRFKVEQQPE